MKEDLFNMSRDEKIDFIIKPVLVILDYTESLVDEEILKNSEDDLNLDF